VLLPLGGEYSVFSAAHLLDLANELVLVAPIGIPLAMLARWGRRHDPTMALLRPFFILAVAGSLLVMVVVNPTLGMARDWDLMALAPLLITVVLAYCAARNPLTERWASRVLVVAVWCIAPWVLMNHSRDAAVARFANLLRLDRDRPGTAYGYELLATFQRSHGNPAAAIEAMMAALERRPGYQRYLDQTRDIVNTMNPMAAAHLADELAAEPVDPPHLFVLAVLRGRAGEGAVERKLLAELRHSPAYACQAEALSIRSLLRERQFGAAVAAAESAREHWPEDAETHFLLGLSRLGVTDCAGAVAEMEAAARMGWAGDDIDFHLGFAHDQCGESTAAQTFYERYLERNPQGPYAEMARRKLGVIP
jgi:hypothetical protein